MQMNKDSGSHPFPTSTLGQNIKPLKKTSIKLNFGSSPLEREKPENFKRYQAKNPKWASFISEGEYDHTSFDLKVLEKCKSLQLTTIAFRGRQTGGTVGHFDGQIKNLYRNSKYLQKLDFGAGAVGEQRFIDVQRWIKKQKHLTDLSLVPYWFPVDDEDEIEDYDIEFGRTAGVVDLIHFLHAQIRKLTLFGFHSEEIKDGLNFQIMNRLQQFTVRAACRPEGCDGEHDEFGDAHIGFIKKAIKSETLKILTLDNQADATPDEFWESLKKNIIPLVKKPLLIQAKVDYRYSNVITNRLFKKIFANLPPHIKVTYTVRDISYFLSLPSGFEVIGEDDGVSDCEDEDDEDLEDEDDD